MKYCIVAVLLLLVFCTGCSKKHNPWLDGEYQNTFEQLQAAKDSVVLLEQAEKAALAEEDYETASHYRVRRDEFEAKIPELQRKFNTLEAARQERLDKQHEQNMIRGE